MRFVLIDRLLELELGKRAVAQTMFPPTLDVLADHFPGHPLIPGVLITEAMAQTAGWLLAATLGFERWPLLCMIHSAKFRRPVEPGEQLRLTADIRSMHADDYAVDVDVQIAGATVAGARLMFHAFDFSLATEDRASFERWSHEIFRDLGGPALLAANASGPAPG